ncbi:sigma-70 family RNA polymerase sigma factor [Planctomycetota bacterium]
MTSSNDPKVVEDLILNNLPAISTLCNRMFRNKEDAEDAAQQAVIKILAELPKYRGEGPIKHWLLKITLNTVLELKRKTKRRLTKERKAMANSSSPFQEEDSLIEEESREQIRQAIAELPEDLQAPLIFHYYHKLNQSEIAKLCNVSQKTVSQRLDRALKLLQPNLSTAGVATGVPLMGILEQATLDAVSPGLLNTAQASIATWTAAGGMTTLGSSAVLAKAALIAGGSIMNTKLIILGTIIAVAGFLGGTIIPGVLSHSNKDDAKLEQRITQLQEDLQAETSSSGALKIQYEEEQVDFNRQIGDLRVQVSTLQKKLEGSVASNAALQENVDRLNGELEKHKQQLVANASDNSDGEITLTTEVMSKIDKVIGIFDQMRKNPEKEALLGIQLVGQLGSISAEEYQLMQDYHATGSDPELVSTTAMVIMWALGFRTKSANEVGKDFMKDYLDHIENKGYTEDFAISSMHILANSVEPYFDNYEAIVANLEDTEKFRLRYLAVKFSNEPQRPHYQSASVRLLGRMHGDGAMQQIMRVFEQRANPINVRRNALSGLGWRTDRQLLNFLQTFKGVEEDEYLKQRLPAIIVEMENRLIKLEEN